MKKSIFAVSLLFIASLNSNAENAFQGAVKYIERFQNPFFFSDLYKLPEDISEQGEGNFVNSLGEVATNIKLEKITTNCESQYLWPHFIESAYAWIDEERNLKLYLYTFNAATNDNVLITVKASKFNVQYWTYNVVANGNPKWKVKSATLELEKADFETEGTLANGFVEIKLNGISEDGGKWSNNIKGYFKAKIKSAAPSVYRAQK